MLLKENVYFLSDSQLFAAIGAKVRYWRLEQNLSQDKLAENSAVSSSTVKKIEAGKSIALDKLVRVLRTLRKLDVLNEFIAEEEMSPAAYFVAQSDYKTRQRASKSKKK